MILRRIRGMSEEVLQYCLRRLSILELIQKRDWKVEGRSIHLWAQKDAPSFRGPHARRILKEHAVATGHGVVKMQILEFLREHPWSMAREVADGVGKNYISIASRLPLLQEQGDVTRWLSYAPGQRPRQGLATPVYRWALAGAEPPSEVGTAVTAKDWMPRTATLAKIARIVQENPALTGVDITTRYREEHGGKGAYAYIMPFLKELTRLGIVQVASVGRRAGRYSADGKLEAFVAEQAQHHWAILKMTRRRLEDLGYRIEIELRPPALEV